MVWRRNLEQQKSGNWRVRVWHHGSLYTKTFRSKRNAQDYLELLERQAASLPLPEVGKTLAEVKAAYLKRLAAKGRAHETTAFYEKVWTRLLSYWAPTTRANLDKEQVWAFITFRQQHGRVGGGSVLKELAALAAALRESDVEVAWKVADFDLSVEHTHRRLPPDAEIAQVYSTLGRADAQLAFLLVLLAGIRPSEAILAEHSWLDREASTITVRSRKTRSEFTTWICPTLAKALPPPGEGPLVGLSETALRSLLHRRTAALKLDPVWTGLEALRHACATWAHEAGATVEQVDLLQGHVKRGSVAQQSYIHAANVTGRRLWLEHVERRFLAALEASQKQVRFRFDLGSANVLELHKTTT
jgi:integrase